MDVNDRNYSRRRGPCTATGCGGFASEASYFVVQTHLIHSLHCPPVYAHLGYANILSLFRCVNVTCATSRVRSRVDLLWHRSPVPLQLPFSPCAAQHRVTTAATSPCAWVFCSSHGWLCRCPSALPRNNGRTAHFQRSSHAHPRPLCCR
jgi:hypothetical protein